MTIIKKTTIFMCICLLFALFVMRQPTTHSQDDDGDTACTDLIAQALQTIGSACAEIGRNEACYGHNAINAVPIETADFEFAETGDLADIADFVSIETQSANPENGTWGIAFVSVQADLPDDTDENLTFVLIGETSLGHDAALDEPTTQAFTLQSTNGETCAEAPDGLLIQSPEGQRARIVMNGVELTMSSTLFVKAQEDDEMVLQGLDGEIEVTADGQTEILEPGFVTTVPLDGLTADGTPTPPEPVDPEINFPFDLLTDLLPESDTSASAGASGSPNLPQTYNGESFTFSYPEGWATQPVPATEFLGAYIALSNNPAYLEANINDPSSSGNTAPNTVFLLIYTIDQFSGGEYSSAEAAIQGFIDTVSGFEETYIVNEAPTTITLGPHSATRAQVGFNFPQDPWDGPIYGFGKVVIPIRVTPGGYGEYQAIVEEILASFVFE